MEKSPIFNMKLMFIKPRKVGNISLRLPMKPLMWPVCGYYIVLFNYTIALFFTGPLSNSLQRMSSTLGMVLN